jgi:hypothetical protein
MAASGGLQCLSEESMPDGRWAPGSARPIVDQVTETGPPRSRSA